MTDFTPAIRLAWMLVIVATALLVVVLKVGGPA